MAVLTLIVAMLVGQLAAVQQRQKDLGRVEFAYEGEYERLIEYLGPKTKVMGNYNFSGKVSIDASKPIYTREHHQPSGEDLSINRVSITPTFATMFGRIQSKKAPLNQTKKKGGYTATKMDLPFQTSAWLPTVSLLVANDEDAKSIEDVGEETREGRRCRVLIYRFKDLFENKFWVDLDRNGLVIAFESRTGGELERVTRIEEVTAHRSPNGRTVWLPSRIVSEGYLNRVRATNSGWLGKPVDRTTTRIVASTVVVDGDGKPVQEVQFERNSPIKDETMPVATALVTPANAPPKPKYRPVSEKDVLQTITEADIQKAQLQATLRPPPVDWTQRIAWLLVVVGVLGAAFTWYRNQQAP